MGVGETPKRSRWDQTPVASNGFADIPMTPKTHISHKKGRFGDAGYCVLLIDWGNHRRMPRRWCDDRVSSRGKDSIKFLVAEVAIVLVLLHEARRIHDDRSQIKLESSVQGLCS